MSLTIQSCYGSDGVTRSNDIPCDPNAEVSACCGTAGSICIDNLHCISPDGAPVPGTCTDKEWASSGGQTVGCPCPGRNLDNQVLNYLDSVTMCPDGGYCCEWRNFDCCEAGESLPIINYGLSGILIPDSTDEASLSPYYANLAVSTDPITRETSTATSNSASTTKSRSQTSSQTSTGTPFPFPTDPANASTPASPTSSAVTYALPNTSRGLSPGAGAGIGVAVGTTAVVLAVGFVLLFVRRRGKRRSPPPPQEMAVDTSTAKSWAPVPPSYPASPYHEAPSPHHAYNRHEMYDAQSTAAELDSSTRLS